MLSWQGATLTVCTVQLSPQVWVPPNSCPKPSPSPSFVSLCLAYCECSDNAKWRCRAPTLRRHSNRQHRQGWVALALAGWQPSTLCCPLLTLSTPFTLFPHTLDALLLKACTHHRHHHHHHHHTTTTTVCLCTCTALHSTTTTTTDAGHDKGCSGPDRVEP